MSRYFTGEENLPAYTQNIPDSFQISFIHQNDWSNGELIAFYLGGVGSGLYIISQFIHSIVGLIFGFLLVAVGKNVSHIISSTKPKRSLRALLRPRTSWISRGAVFVFLFIVFGFLEITHELKWIHWNEHISFVFSIFAFASAVFVMIYIGFVLADARAIPLWNSPIMPAIFLVYSICFGAGAASILSPFMTLWQKETILGILIITIVLSLLLIITHILTLKRSGLAGMRSYEQLIRNDLNIYFIGGVLLMGLVLPLVMTGTALFYNVTSNTLFVIIGVCVLTGGLFYEKSILEAAIFTPIFDK